MTWKSCFLLWTLGCVVGVLGAWLIPQQYLVQPDWHHVALTQHETARRMSLDGRVALTLPPVEGQVRQSWLAWIDGRQTLTVEQCVVPEPPSQRYVGDVLLVQDEAVKPSCDAVQAAMFKAWEDVQAGLIVGRLEAACGRVLPMDPKGDTVGYLAALLRQRPESCEALAALHRSLGLPRQ